MIVEAMWRKWRLTLLAFVLALATGLRTIRADPSGSPGPTAVAGVARVEFPGIHNAFRIGDRYFTGSVPEGEEAFAALAKAGVKTIITVDGAQPDVETARRHGIRYIHLPHGYDGVSSNAMVQIAKAVTTFEGPFFFHCHHGKHRGPAAAAIACLTTEGWTPSMADQWLHMAGTDTNYAGLYRTVESFRPFTAEKLRTIPADLPERAKVSSLVDSMVEIDARWDHLKAVRRAGYTALKDHPDIDPANEATILMEHYREAQRLEETKAKGERFKKLFADGEEQCRQAAGLLREHRAAPDEARLDLLNRTFDAIGQTCTACHKQFRN